MAKPALLSFTLILATLLSCDMPGCQNTNPVFERNSPDSKEYKQELTKQLRTNKNGNLSYRMDGYIESSDKAYLVIGIVGDSLCAEGHMLVEDWDESLKGIRRTKGMGYIGAELRGLKYSINEDGILVYNSLERIID